MKPTKNQYYCLDCGRIKMLFESKKKADNFIKFNRDAFEEEGKKVPVRSYYCPVCGGWHVTSNPNEEHFNTISYQNNQLTKMERIVQMKMQKRNHESFLIRKRALVEEAKQLYREQNFLESLRKCREVLKLLKENGKDWWNDNQYVAKLMYENLCREASCIDECFKNNDYVRVQNIISHCGCVMKELEAISGFDEYRQVLDQYMDNSIEKLKRRKKVDSLKSKLKNISRKINEAWVYLSQNKYAKVRSEIEKYTAELVSISQDYKEKEDILPVVNKLYNLRETYNMKLNLAVA